MRAVAGRIVSSRPISLSRASKTLSRFAASDSASIGRPEVAAYLRRASAAFDELVSVHRELRSYGKAESLDFDGESKRSKKRKVGGVGELGSEDLVVGEREKGGVLGSEEVRDGKRMKEQHNKVRGKEERNDFDAVKVEKIEVLVKESVELSGKHGGEAKVVETGVQRIDVQKKKKKSKNHGNDESEEVNNKEKIEKAMLKQERMNFDIEEKSVVKGVQLVSVVMSGDDGVIGLDVRKRRKKLDKENSYLEVRDEKIVVAREEERRQEEGKKNKKEKVILEKKNSLDLKHKEDIATEKWQGGPNDQSEQHRKKKKKKEKAEN